MTDDKIIFHITYPDGTTDQVSVLPEEEILAAQAELEALYRRLVTEFELEVEALRLDQTQRLQAAVAAWVADKWHSSALEVDQ